MKQPEFLDKIRTPEKWKTAALERVIEKEKEPVLKRWQMRGVVAVTAVLVLSIGIVPGFFGTSVARYDEEETSAAAESSECTESTAEQDSGPAVVIKKKNYNGFDISGYPEEKQAALGELSGRYAYTEAVTVLDYQVETDKSVTIVGKREAHKPGNRVFITTIPAECDTSYIKFGEMIALAFREYVSDDNYTVEDTVSRMIGGFMYKAQESVSLAECAECMDIGETIDTEFKAAVLSANAAAGQAEDETNSKTKKLVARHYANNYKVKPRVSVDIIQEKNEAGELPVKAENMAVLFDERLEVDGTATQLCTVKLTDRNRSPLCLQKNDDEYVLLVGDKKAEITITSTTETEVVDMKVIPYHDETSAEYLSIWLIDKEHTGNIRGNLDITINIKDPEEEITESDAEYSAEMTE